MPDTTFAYLADALVSVKAELDNQYRERISKALELEIMRGDLMPQPDTFANAGFFLNALYIGLAETRNMVLDDVLRRLINVGGYSDYAVSRYVLRLINRVARETGDEGLIQKLMAEAEAPEIHADDPYAGVPMIGPGPKGPTCGSDSSRNVTS